MVEKEREEIVNEFFRDYLGLQEGLFKIDERTDTVLIEPFCVSVGDFLKKVTGLGLEVRYPGGSVSHFEIPIGIIEKVYKVFDDIRELGISGIPGEDLIDRVRDIYYERGTYTSIFRLKKDMSPFCLQIKTEPCLRGIPKYLGDRDLEADPLEQDPRYWKACYIGEKMVRIFLFLEQ